MKTFCLYAYLFFLCSTVYAEEGIDTVSFWEKPLFIIDCTVSDTRKQERPTPCLSIAHDTLIVFPTHRDTITFFSFSGQIVRKLYNKLDFFPTHIHYADDEDLIYLMSVGTWSKVFDTLIYAINLEGEIEQKHRWRNGNIDEWFIRTKQLSKSERKVVKKQFRVREPNPYYAGTGITKNVLYDISALISQRYVLMDRYTGYSFIKKIIQPDSNNKGYNLESRYFNAYDLATSKPVILIATTVEVLYKSGDLPPECEKIEWYVTKKTISPGCCGSNKDGSYIQVVEGVRCFVFTKFTIEE